MLAVLDFTLAVWEEKFSKAISRLHFLKSIELVDEWQYLLLFYSSQIYCFMGELNLAESHIREALDLNIVKQAELLRGYILLGCSMVLLMQDKQDIQPEIMDEMMPLAEKHDYKYLLGHGKRMAAFTGYRNHDPEKALKLLEESTGFFETIGNIPMMAANNLYRCLWLCQGSGAKEDILLEAQRALKDLMAEPSGMCLQEIGLSLFGAVAREGGEYQLADESLSAALEKSKAKGTAQVTAGVLLHLAKLRYDTGRHQEGDAFLHQAFDTAKDYQYVMFWDLHFPTLVEMSARCLQVGIHGDWARSLVERYFGSDGAEYLVMKAALVKKDLFRELAAAFLYRYGGDHETHLPKIYFSLFGRFTMTVDGVIVPESEWKTKKIAGVLKFLLVHRNRLVSKDQLMEVFWPGVDKKLASTSLRAALYELKKVLRKYGLSTEGQMSLLNENRNSLGIYAGNALTVDVDLFLAHFEELKKLPEKNLEEKKEILEMLVLLYQGDLLEEELYEDWTFTEREGLRSIYLRAAADLSGIYARDNEGDKAEKLLLKMLSNDRYNEEACLRLLELYISNNQKSRAVRLYEKFSSRFEKDLGIQPNHSLLAAIKEHQ